MLKREEAAEPNSCWNKARSDEPLFVLLARDVAAAETMRFWAARRVELGKNKLDDPQIVSALADADRMAAVVGCINYRTHGGGMAGHDEDEDLELRPGGFYVSLEGDVWCCYRIDLSAPPHEQALCVETRSGRLGYFFVDGYDLGGNGKTALVKECPPGTASLAARG
jgi:hypothetical protein